MHAPIIVVACVTCSKDNICNMHITTSTDIILENVASLHRRGHTVKRV